MNTTTRWLMAASILCSATTAEDTAPAQSDTVTIRGEVYAIWPAEDLRARGLPVRDVPRQRNAAWVYIEAINAYLDLPDELGDQFDYAVGTAWPTGATELADFLTDERNQRAIRAARRAGGFERCQMPYFGDTSESVIGVLLPNLSQMRSLSKLITVEGRRLEAQGKYDAAIDHYLAVMSLGENVAQGFTLIEGLVGVASWSLAEDATTGMVLRRSLTAAQLARIESEFARRTARLPSVSRGLEGERAFGPAIVDELASRPFQFVGGLGGLTEGSGEMAVFDVAAGENVRPTDGWGRLEKRIGQLVFPDRAIKRHMLGFYDRCVARADASPARTSEPFDDEQYIRESIPKWDVISRAFLPSLSRATLLGRRLKARFALARTVTAVRRYMVNHEDERPGDLTDVADLLPARARIDPFSGEPLIYRQTEDGWIVYSVGPNGDDDGGQSGERWEELDMARRFPPEALDPYRGSP